MPKQTTETIKKLMDGRLRLERRNANPMIYARSYLQGKDVVFRTGQTAPHLAQEVAESWYLDQRQRIQKGESLHGRLFSDVADAFLKHADTTLRGEISDGQIEQYGIKWNVLKPHMTGVKVTDIDSHFLVQLRAKRSQQTMNQGTPISNSTIQKDFIFLRLVLKYARDVEKCLGHLPTFPPFRGEAFAVIPNPTPFLTLRQYMTLVHKAVERMREPDLNPRTRRQREELWAFIAICVGAALRVGEAHSIRWQDCTLTTMNADKQPAVHMRVRGKHVKRKGVGVREDAYGFYHAVEAFRFLQESRPEAKPDDFLFLEDHRDGLNELLAAVELKTAPNGELRTAKSLRATGLSMRIEHAENPNLTDIAKWARTSVSMIERFYDQNHPRSAVARAARFRGDPRNREEGETSTQS